MSAARSGTGSGGRRGGGGTGPGTGKRGGASNAGPPDASGLLPLTDLAFSILLALSDRNLHGYALLKELRGRTGRERLRTGTVYAALARLQDDGLVEQVGHPSGDRRRRHYAPTRLGRASARAEAERLRELVAEARTKRVLPGAT